MLREAGSTLDTYNLPPCDESMPASAHVDDESNADSDMPSARRSWLDRYHREEGEEGLLRALIHAGLALLNPEQRAFYDEVAFTCSCTHRHHLGKQHPNSHVHAH